VNIGEDLPVHQKKEDVEHDLLEEERVLAHKRGPWTRERKEGTRRLEGNCPPRERWLCGISRREGGKHAQREKKMGIDISLLPKSSGWGVSGKSKE